MRTTARQIGRELRSGAEWTAALLRIAQTRPWYRLLAEATANLHWGRRNGRHPGCTA